MSPLPAHGTKRFAEGKTLMRGGFTPPAQIKSLGVPQNGRFCGQGGMRASIYNAVTEEGCRALAEFMEEFRKNH